MSARVSSRPVLAMQKVEGSSPFIRFSQMSVSPAPERVLRFAPRDGSLLSSSRLIGIQRFAPGRTWRCLLAVRHHEPSSPTRGTPSRWQMHRLDLEATAGDEPGGQRVGVPHLSCSALVAAPDETRDGGHEVKDVLSE